MIRSTSSHTRSLASFPFELYIGIKIEFEMTTDFESDLAEGDNMVYQKSYLQYKL